MRLIWCLVLVASCLLTSTPAQAQTVLLRDDFSGGTFNTSTWNVANYTFGGNRAWFGNTPTLSGGIATLRLDTYNAEHVGNFRGTEIFSNQTFPLGATGVEFEARVRTTMTTRGAVTSFFTYATAPTNGFAHEIDYEFLTNQINGSATNHKVLTTSWKDWGAPGSTFNDGVHHRDANPTVPNLDLTQFNTFKIRWLPDHTEWLVNGTLVSSWADAHPTVDTPIRFNFWAPDSGWVNAYDANLTAALTPGANQSFTYDIDYVQVSTVPVPEPIGGLIVGGIDALFAAIRMKRRRKAALPADPRIDGEQG